MKTLIFLFINLCFLQSFSQDKNLLKEFGIEKDSINELTFKSSDEFESFVKIFQEKKGFRPQWLIFDSTGKLLKHKLDIHIKECGKGDVAEIKKKYQKKLPNISEVDTFFNEELIKPNGENYIIIFMWMKGLGLYNEHTFDTYNVWKENDNLDFYFLNLNTE